MEKCLRQWSEHTLSGVRSSSCRSTLPQAPPAQPNNPDVRSAAECVLPSLACVYIYPPSQSHFTTFSTLLAAQTSSSMSTDYCKQAASTAGVLTVLTVLCLAFTEIAISQLRAVGRRLLATRTRYNMMLN